MKKTKLFLALCLAGSMSYAQMISTYAGTGVGGFSGDGGFATQAKINTYDTDYIVQEIISDASGNIYFSDAINGRVRKVDAVTGIISTFAGGGTGGDGIAATSASIVKPSGLAIDGSGNIYISEFGAHRIRKVNTSGIISTVAGTGTAGYNGDGISATSAKLNYPQGICFDASSGNLYIADGVNFRIRVVNSSGTISTYAGDGASGNIDNSPATSGELGHPIAVKIYSGYVYISDVGNNSIRRVNMAHNVLSTFSTPGGVDIYPDGSGNLFLTTGTGNTAQKVNLTGTPVYTTVAGNGTSGYTGDGGLATSAELSNTVGVFVTSSGDFYVLGMNCTVRKISTICPAIAGPNVIDQQSCCGGSWPGIQIGSPSISGLSYSWSPSTALSTTTIAQPTSTWSNTSTSQVYTVTVSGSTCVTNTSTVQVSAHSSANNCCRLANQGGNGGYIDGATPTLNVFPNPAKGNVTLYISNDAEYIKVTDIQGRVVYEIKNSTAGDQQIDISKYSKGIYFVTAKMGNTIEKQKLVVE